MLGVWWPSTSSATMPMHTQREGHMATLSRRSIRRSSMPEAAGSSTMPLEPPAKQVAAIDHRVDGSRGRQQVATAPSASSGQPPFATSTAAMLSTPLAKHDPPSTGCIECWAKTLASRSFKSARPCLAPHASGDQSCHKVVEVLEGWLRPHPKQPLDGSDGIRTRQHGLKWPRVDLGRFLRRFFSIAHIRCRMGGSVTFFKYVAPYMY